MAAAAALIGFAALILGAFSRLGVWRQVLGAVIAVIAMQLVHTVVTGAVAREAALWPLVHLPPLAGFAGAGMSLWLAARPRRRPAAPAAAEAAA
jgi:lipopolysaccharide export system permease protein